MQLQEPELDADERATLEQFLDYYRAVVSRKILGLTREQAGTRSIVSTQLSIAGIVKHLALVEDSWFQEVLHGRTMPEPWDPEEFNRDPDWEFHSAPTDEPEHLLQLYSDACGRSRQAIERLDLGFVNGSTSNPDGVSLRWIMVHMIEETARHAGHADLIREAIDGETAD